MAAPPQARTVISVLLAFDATIQRAAHEISSSWRGRSRSALPAAEAASMRQTTEESAKDCVRQLWAQPKTTPSAPINQSIYESINQSIIEPTKTSKA